MNLDEIAKQCHEDSVDWFPTVAYDVPYQTLCLTGEVGEFANVLKKSIRTNQQIFGTSTREELCEELTDAFIYLMCLAELLGMDMEWWYKMKREKNVARFEKKTRPIKDVPLA